MTENKRLEEIEQRVRELPSVQNGAFAEIIRGLYAGKPLLGKGGLLTDLVKDLTQVALQGEMDSHLQENGLEDASNRRNGISKKRIKMSSGTFDLEVPRDRNCSFEPQIVKKRQTVLNDELDSKILALYSLGTSYNDISHHLSDIYGVDVSGATITAVTDRLLPQIIEFRNRPLESIYTIVFLDAMFFKVRQDNKVTTKVLYNIMGINQSGHKDILGFYSCESEGAHFWLSVLNDLKARGVKDILIASIDGLKGFPESIAASFPKTEIQLCIVHQIRNSLKHVASKNQKEFMADLKLVYKADTKELAEYSNLY